MEEQRAPQERQWWDTMDLVTLPLVWQNRVCQAVFHVLTGDEEQVLVARKNLHTDPELRAVEEGFLRLAASVSEFDGHDLDPDFEAKLAYVRTWPTPLIDTLLAHYTVAAIMPLVDPLEPGEG